MPGRFSVHIVSFEIRLWFAKPIRLAALQYRPANLIGFTTASSHKNDLTTIFVLAQSQGASVLVLMSTKNPPLSGGFLYITNF
ncbi:MAG: hypothetical protein IT249_07055 [Chitinophagaceae bacterium]|nr:hypothetical protein [Chitinophagaceae bacterium]